MRLPLCLPTANTLFHLKVPCVFKAHSFHCLHMLLWLSVTFKKQFLPIETHDQFFFFTLSNTNKQQHQSDVILDMMTAKQEELSKIACVPQGESTKDFPETMDADDFLSYPTLSNGTVAGLDLLVLMSPVFGEPILLPANHCPTGIAALKRSLQPKWSRITRRLWNMLVSKKSSTTTLLLTLLGSLQERSSTFPGITWKEEKPIQQ